MFRAATKVRLLFLDGLTVTAAHYAVASPPRVSVLAFH